MSGHKLLSIENATHLLTNNIPQTTFVELFSKFMTHGNSNKLHEAPIGLRPRGRDEFLLRRPVDKLGTTSTWTREAGVVKICFNLGNIVGRLRLDRRKSRRGAVVSDFRVNIAVVGARGVVLEWFFLPFKLA